MRIHDAYRSPVDLNSKPAVAAKSGGSASGSSRTTGEDVKVSVSAKARELATASSQEESRLEGLRKSINDGTFKIDSHAIASKMLGDAADGA